MHSRRDRDVGGVLILTLILVVVLSVVVLALASFVSAGLKSSDVASERTDTNADSSNVMNWAIEQFAKKQLRPDDHCGDAPTYATIAVPSGLFTNGSSSTLVCAQTAPITGEPVVHLIATSQGDQTRVVEATVEVPQYTHGARISDWRVDIPIAVPAYVTTTTTGTATTTTTVVANVAPVANATSWTANPSTTSTLLLNATDSDGSIVSAAISGTYPGTWVITPTGSSVQLTVDATVGTFNLAYTVTDDDGAVSTSAPLTINVNAAATTTTAPSTTTTTTLAPNPACTFTVTSSAADQKSGIGNLSISNTGGSFTGWQVQINWPNSWDASWDPAVSATTPSMTVSGGQTVVQNASINFSASLVWTGGNPKIVSGATRTCSVISP